LTTESALFFDGLSDFHIEFAPRASHPTPSIMG